MYSKLIIAKQPNLVTSKNKLLYVKIYNNKDKLLSTTVAYPTKNTYNLVFIVNSQLTLKCLNYLIKEKIAELDVNTKISTLPWWEANNFYNYYNMHLTSKALLNVL